ncbi:MAG: hypothetical protein FJ100_08655 [Deltaproteobacteria bacterium]|nr:hypothetical protein [Deltaproteobacteria bacterium]
MPRLPAACTQLLGVRQPILGRWAACAAAAVVGLSAASCTEGDGAATATDATGGGGTSGGDTVAVDGATTGGSDVGAGGDSVTTVDTTAAEATGDAGGATDAGETPDQTSGATDGSTTNPDTAGDTTVKPDGGGSGDAVIAPDGTTSGGDNFKELLVKVLGPSGKDWIQSMGGNSQLSGVAYGAPEEISWSASNGKSGKITPTEKWKTSVIQLDKGDNHFTITAKKGNQVVTDTVHLTYNPVFAFEGAPDMSPNVLFVNENAKVVVHFSATAAIANGQDKPIIDASTIQLVEVDEQGKPIAGGYTANLKDSGQGGNCDDVSKDAVYSECANINAKEAKTKYFRVKAKVDVGEVYEAWSPVTVVDVVQRFDKPTCNAIVSLQGKVKGDYVTAVTGGADWKKAQADAIAALKADSSVADAGPANGNGYGVWIRYKTGQLGALNLAPADMRSSAGAVGPGAALPTFSVGTRRALALAPFQSEFSKLGGDEAEKLGNDLKAKQCPPYAVDAANNSQAFLRWYREMSSYGMVAISGHGEVLFGDMGADVYKSLGWEHQGAQEVVWSGEPVNCSALSGSTATCNQAGNGCPTGESCVKTSLQGGVCVDSTQADIMRGRAIIGDQTYGFVPAFLRHHHVQQFPQSIVYLGACRTMYNGSLATQLWGSGAAAVVGFSDYVASEYAAAQGGKFLDGLANGLSVNQALPTSTDDPKYGGRMRHIGIDEANLKNEALINPSWDSGNLTGWKPVGDGRVVSRLGVTIPVAGKYMGIISTGLGFTAQNGSLTQPFCIDKAQNEMCFFWKFYSEEFIEWCGSQFMDSFTATLKSDTASVKMVDVYIDSLCPYDCGEKSPCEPGSPTCKCGKDWKTLSPSDVNFDQGGVHMTPWQKTCVDVGALGLSGSGKKVDLTFFATDKGDSIFDTVILIDEVTIK